MRRKSQRQMNRDRLIKDEVQEILAMYRALQDSYDRLSDKGGINAELITFDGFDGNNEDEYLRAAREIAVATRGAGVPNSHMPRIRGYQLMLQRWRSSHNKEDLTKEDILRIVRG